MMGIEANSCPSHFALDDHELHGGGNPAIRRHLEGCPRCQGRIVERATDLASFRGTSAQSWTRIVARAQERRREDRRRLLFFQLPALAVGLSAAVLAIKTRRASEGAAPSYVAPKGLAPVEIVCRRDATTFVLVPADDVRPGDELRFRPRPVRPDARFIQIGSVDGTGRYTPFYPSTPGAVSVALPERGQALEGSIRLDTAPGPERLFVVLSAAPVSEKAVRRAAEARATAGATLDEIDGVPVTTTWIVLRKPMGAATTP